MLKLFLVLLLSTFAFASSTPEALPPVEGNLWPSAISPVPFTFTSGKLKKCEREVFSGLINYECSLEKTPFVVGKNSYQFERVIIQYRDYPSKGNVADYTFTTKAKYAQGRKPLESTVLLRLHFYTDQPDAIRGYFRVSAIGDQTRLTAAPK